MVKIPKHIEIVRSTRRGLSSMSQRSCDGIREVLEQHYEKVGVTLLNDLTDLDNLVGLQPDLVFLGMKFLPMNPELGQADPDRIWIANYLDENNIRYTGSGHIAHELELNKHLAKQRAIDAGIQTSPFYVALQNQPQVRTDMPLTFPLFIKPTNRGGGLGIDSSSIAHNFDQLESKVASLTTDFRSDSLVEQYLPGREFSVAILQDEHTDTLSIMPIELTAGENEDGDSILSQEMKSSNQEMVSVITDEALLREIVDFASAVYVALGARDYGRIDIRLDEQGVPHFLEANLIPSLISGYGSFPKACLLNIDLNHENMILQIARLGLRRNQPA